MSVLVGRQAPEFEAKAVVNGSQIQQIKLSSFRGQYVVLFFYPFDFTFVCPTELHAFQENLIDFEQRNTQVIAVSVDSHHSHLAWLNTPKDNGGIQGITYPVVSDIHKQISRDYDVLSEALGASYRGLFLIDKQGIVRHQVVNDTALGRSIDEALRMVDALQFNEKHGEVCPANWKSGKKALQATREGVAAYFQGGK